MSAEAEERLARHARQLGRGKSVVVREWIMERLDRESVDEEMRRAAQFIAATTSVGELDRLDAATDEWLHALDEEDGGYDWGPQGAPA